MSAKEIHVAPISATDANALVRRIHYSGKVVNNSQLHLGVFYRGRLEGAMQFGPPMCKKHVIGLVSGTAWNGLLELNRMAFSNVLPKNSESRALGVAFRMIKKTYPHIEWILSFADGAQCGDGTIYRAAGFVLTGVQKNESIIRLPDGTIGASITYAKANKAIANGGKASPPKGSAPLPGFQLRYIYFLDPAARERLTVPALPYDTIDKMGARMYKGQRASNIDSDVSSYQLEKGGATPTDALQCAGEV